MAVSASRAISAVAELHVVFGLVRKLFCLNCLSMCYINYISVLC